MTSEEYEQLIIRYKTASNIVSKIVDCNKSLRYWDKQVQKSTTLSQVKTNCEKYNLVVEKKKSLEKEFSAL